MRWKIFHVERKNFISEISLNYISILNHGDINLTDDATTQHYGIFYSNAINDNTNLFKTLILFLIVSSYSRI